MTEILSSDEIDQLLSAINAGGTEPRDFKPAADTRKIKIYDFKRPDKFSKKHIRLISIMHEFFSRLITKRLSDLLRSLVHIHVASVDQLTYEEFVRSVPTPTTIGIIEMFPLNGKVLLEVDPAISFSIIDRLMGGFGEGCRTQHELTNIEKTIMSEIIICMLENLQEAWTRVIELQPSLTRIETNPQFCDIALQNEMTVLITLETKVGDVEGMMNLCIPYATVESIMDKFSYEYWYERKSCLSTVKKYYLHDRDDVPVKLIAEMAYDYFSIQEVTGWKKGVVINFHHLSSTTCLLRLGDNCLWDCEILPEEKKLQKLIKITGFNKYLHGKERVEIMERENEIIANALQTAPIKITIELGESYKTIKDLYSMAEGSILELDKPVSEPLDIRANGVLIAKGEVITVDEHFAVRIVEISSSSV